MAGRTLVLSAVMASCAMLVATVRDMEPFPIRQSLSGIPHQIGSWRQHSSSQFDAKTLSALGADEILNRIYLNSSLSSIALYIGYYQTQQAGHAVHSPLNCLPGAGWTLTEKRTISIPVHSRSAIPAALDAGDLRTIQVNRILITKGKTCQLVLYWYQSHGRVVASEYWGKVFSVLDAIRLNRNDAALIRVINPLRAESTAAQAAENRAVDFVQSLFPMLSRFLPE